MAELGERDVKQRTLFDLRKVVKLQSSAIMFTPEDIEGLRQHLADPGTSRHLLLNSLRKLDCYKLLAGDLAACEIGSAVATLVQHPKLEVARLAAALLDKWREMVEGAGQVAGVERDLFRQVSYDVAAAAAAPDGDPQEFYLKAPLTQAEIEAAEAAAAAAERKRSLRQRLRAEEALFDSDGEAEGAVACAAQGPHGQGQGGAAGGGDEHMESASESEDKIESGDSSDEEWRPAAALKRAGAKRQHAGGGGGGKKQQGSGGGKGSKDGMVQSTLKWALGREKDKEKENNGS
eukprot:scaffold5.g896.t1